MSRTVVHTTKDDLIRAGQGAIPGKSHDLAGGGCFSRRCFCFRPLKLFRHAQAIDKRSEPTARPRGACDQLGRQKLIQCLDYCLDEIVQLPGFVLSNLAIDRCGYRLSAGPCFGSAGTPREVRELIGVVASRGRPTRRPELLANCRSATQQMTV
jgi:hypothetical protein